MMTLKTPVLSILIGEGGSGGALALAVADEVWMLENAVYSVVSPEGCASILWKDPAKTAQAAECLRLTSQDLYKMGVIEKIIREPKDKDDKLFHSLRNTISVSYTHLDVYKRQDSLDTVELVMNLEDEFHVEIEVDEAINTVGDLVKIIEGLL